MCFMWAIYTDLSFLIVNEIPRVWLNLKENIQAGYRNDSGIVNCTCVDKTSLNYGADTNLSFIIAYEILRLNLNEFNKKYPGRLQK